jgi:hypothetical protein
VIVVRDHSPSAVVAAGQHALATGVAEHTLAGAVVYQRAGDLHQVLIEPGFALALMAVLSAGSAGW